MPKQKTATSRSILGGIFLLIAALGCAYAFVPGAEEAFDALRGKQPERSYPNALDNIQRLEGWLPHWTNQRTLALNAAKEGFTDLLFFNGSISEVGDCSLESESRLSSAIAALEGKPVRKWLTVTNHGRSLAAALDPANRSKHIIDLVALWKQSGCDHLDLDYEGLNLAQAQSLRDLITPLSQALVAANPKARLSVTLQPVDVNIRPDQVSIYREMLESPELVTMRLMCYDSHWSTSLPGAHYPFEAFDRLLLTFAEHHEKLCVALPLYGYAWPRPEDASMPKASIVTLKDGPPANAQEVGVPSEQESAWTWQNPTGQTIHSNLPTPYWLNARIKHTLRMGVGAVAFWHLGCHEASQICQMADQTSGQTFAAPAHNTDSWDEQLEPWKRRVCTIYTAKTGDTFESIASATGIKRFTLIRFNESLYGKDLAGREVFVPSK